MNPSGTRPRQSVHPQYAKSQSVKTSALLTVPPPTSCRFTAGPYRGRLSGISLSTEMADDVPKQRVAHGSAKAQPVALCVSSNLRTWLRCCMRVPWCLNSCRVASALSVCSKDFVPYTFNASWRHKIAKVRYQVMNWPEYDAAHDAPIIDAGAGNCLPAGGLPPIVSREPERYESRGSREACSSARSSLAGAEPAGR